MQSNGFTGIGWFESVERVGLRIPLLSCSSRICQLAARLGDGATEFAGCFQPLPDDELGVGDGWLIGNAVGHAAGQFRDFDNEALVGAAPVDDEFVAHSCRSPVGPGSQFSFTIEKAKVEMMRARLFSARRATP